MQPNEERLKVALYARVSSEEQKEGHTIESQLAELRQFAALQRWPVINEYIDEAWSGAALARPSLDRMRDDARNKRFEAVLINDVDRLARDVTHLGVIKRDLERSGVRVIFRKIPAENSPTQNLLVNMLGSFAEFEREMIMDRTRRGRQHKVEVRQQFIGALAPYGYRYIPSTPQSPSGKLMVNPEEAVIVRMVYGWVDSEGLSARAVADRLTAQGFRPRKGGSTWQRSSVLKILRGTAYMGIWYYNKHQLSYRRSLIPGHEPQGKKTSLRRRPQSEWIAVKLLDELKIIAPAQWERVQQQLNRNQCFARRNAKHEYLLSSLVRCGACQAPYCGGASHGRFGYRCWRRCKRMPEISEASLDNSVWRALENALNNPKLLTQAIQGMNQTEPSQAAARHVQNALDGIKAEEGRILEAYRLEILTPEQLGRELDSLKMRRQALEIKQREAAGPKQTDRSVRRSVEEYCNEVRRRLPHLTFETKRNLIRLLVRRITFERDQVRIQGAIPLEGSDEIALTGVDCCGRNRASFADFLIAAPVLKDLTAAQAANRANLIKANQALQRKRHAERNSGS